MPLTIIEAAGQPYQPSNGTEGDIFTGAFCNRCQKSEFEVEGQLVGCDIPCRAMAYGKTDPEYPKEWVRNERGVPCCTAYEPIPGAPKFDA